MKMQIGDDIRDMTPAEIANHKQVIRESEAVKATIEAQEAALASARTKLAALGLTESEIQALIGL